MARFWDRRAQENALYFVDNRLSYRSPGDNQFWERGERDLETLLSSLRVSIEATDEVLEIGCGVGRLTRPIARRGAHVYACDVSGEMLTRAQALNAELDNVTWIKTDGLSLGATPSASIDACVSCVVFQHIPHPRVTLDYVREMGRILRPGGWSAFQVSNDPAVHEPRDTPWMVRLRSRGRALLRRSPGGQDHPAWLGSAVDLDELVKAAEESGLLPERIIGRGTQYCGVLLRRSAQRAA